MNKRTKSSRQRGSHTHGWGSMKKHRGAGSRGGRGNAGSGKRGDGKKPSFWNVNSKIAKLRASKKKGFTSLKKPLKTINVDQLNKFESTNLNLTELGFDKLLGRGKVVRKYELVISQSSELAINKIKKAGGAISGLEKKEEITTKEAVETQDKPQEAN
ncbi:uL15 family ribosomal protein [archaeon]|nr:uL15 family ribosomal protein [archaeon]MBL7056724.1 uL15 family ribosomal protein [Candidatus Woesearchaeota archaeon]